MEEPPWIQNSVVVMNDDQHATLNARVDPRTKRLAAQVADLEDVTLDTFLAVAVEEAIAPDLTWKTRRDLDPVARGILEELEMEFPAQLTASELADRINETRTDVNRILYRTVRAWVRRNELGEGESVVWGLRRATRRNGY